MCRYKYTKRRNKLQRGPVEGPSPPILRKINSEKMIAIIGPEIIREAGICDSGRHFLRWGVIQGIVLETIALSSKYLFFQFTGC